MLRLCLDARYSPRGSARADAARVKIVLADCFSLSDDRLPRHYWLLVTNAEMQTTNTARMRIPQATARTIGMMRPAVNGAFR